MKKIYEKIDELFMEREGRERWLVALGILGVFAWLFWNFSIEPALNKQQSLQAEKQQLELLSQTYLNEIAVLASQVKEDPNIRLRKRLERLEQHLTSLENELESKAEFMRPEQVIPWFEMLMESAENLKLETFTTEVPVPFLTSIDAKGLEKNNLNPLSEVLQYPLTVSLSGDFYSIHYFLEAIAKLPISFYWRSFDYEVKEYPRAEITLELFTLSYPGEKNAKK